MDRVDMPITKPLTYFWSFLFFWKHFMTTCEPSENLQFFWNSKNKEVKRGWACSNKKKTYKPLYFQILYLPHFLFVLNNLKHYGNTIWNFTKPFLKAKKNRLAFKDFKL